MPPPPAAPNPAPLPRACRACGAPLTAERRAAGLCSRAACDPSVVVQAMRAQVRRRADRVELAQREALAEGGERIAAAGRRVGLDLRQIPGAPPPPDLPMAVVPRLARPLGPPDPAQRAAFLDQLDALVEAAFAEDPEPASPETDAPETDAAHGAPEAPWAVAGCATCRGACCTLGATNMAFLTAHELRRLRRRDPALTPDGMRARYVSRLPEASVRDSCLFHTATGCALPREDRAEICNTYRCKGLQSLAETVETGAGRVVVAALAEDGLAEAATWTRDEGWRPEPPADAQADPA